MLSFDLRLECAPVALQARRVERGFGGQCNAARESAHPRGKQTCDSSQRLHREPFRAVPVPRATALVLPGRSTRTAIAQVSSTRLVTEPSNTRPTRSRPIDNYTDSTRAEAARHALLPSRKKPAN